MVRACVQLTLCCVVWQPAQEAAAPAAAALPEEALPEEARDELAKVRAQRQAIEAKVAAMEGTISEAGMVQASRALQPLAAVTRDALSSAVWCRCVPCSSS